MLITENSLCVLALLHDTIAGLFDADPRYEPLPSVFPGPRPHGPHKPNLVGFTSTFASIFTNITGKFADNLGIGCM